MTLLKRVRRGEKLSQAHRSHYYQRLVQMGWGHRNTALAEYALMLLAGISALWGIGLAHAGTGLPVAGLGICLSCADGYGQTTLAGSIEPRRRRLPMLKFNIRTALAVLHDALAAALAWILAYLLRFNFELPAEFAAEMWQTLVWVVPLQVMIFWRFNLYRGIWRYASMTDLRRIFLAVMLSAAAIPLLFWMLRLGLVIPRSVLVIDPLLLMLMMGGSRFVYRLWKEQGLYGAIKLHGEPVLVLGAGDAAASLAKELAQEQRLAAGGLSRRRCREAWAHAEWHAGAGHAGQPAGMGRAAGCAAGDHCHAVQLRISSASARFDLCNAGGRQGAHGAFVR